MKMEQTKEEILNKRDGYGIPTVVNRSKALAAMDEYAKQYSIEFAEWINEEGYWQHECGVWYRKETGKPGIHTYKLYELFLESQK